MSSVQAHDVLVSHVTQAHTFPYIVALCEARPTVFSVYEDHVLALFCLLVPVMPVTQLRQTMDELRSVSVGGVGW